MHDLSSNLLVEQVVSTVVVSSVYKSKLIRSKSDLKSNFLFVRFDTVLVSELSAT